MTVEFTLEAANKKCLHCGVRIRPHTSQKKACMGHPPGSSKATASKYG
jgi:hypothetical protein